MLLSEKRDLQEKQGMNYTIIRGDDWYSGYREFLTNDKTGGKNFFLQKLPHNNDQDKDTTYRQINYWTENGLFDDDREDKNQWRKYNLADYVWLRLIKILRGFGLSLQQLKIVKETLFLKDDNGTALEYFEYYLTYAFGGSTVNLVVFPNGISEILFENQWCASLPTFKTIYPYIKISINEILFSIFKLEHLKPKTGYLFNPSADELKVLVAITNKKYKKIEVVLKSGEIQRMNLTEDVEMNKKQKIVDLIKAGDYQRITLEIENGQLVNIEKMEKEKF